MENGYFYYYYIKFIIIFIVFKYKLTFNMFYFCILNSNNIKFYYVKFQNMFDKIGLCGLFPET